jgi:chemotaxis protein MotA
MSAEEVELRTLTVEGILSVQAGDNPRVVADKLTSYVPPIARSSEEESGGAAAAPQAAQAEAA